MSNDCDCDWNCDSVTVTATASEYPSANEAMCEWENLWASAFDGFIDLKYIHMQIDQSKWRLWLFI